MSDMVKMTNENGEEVSFQVLGMELLNDNAYVILLEPEDVEVTILKAADPMNPECTDYLAVTDDAELEEVFASFKANHAEEFDFAD